MHTDIKIYIEVNSGNITKLNNDLHIRLYIRRNYFETFFYK